ncbi:DUF4397 domain-containing protein [Amantichitinum ursilacus]|uniref:DUF4397 domain-containing protein n=1 Tax=Amantichitinum ursilacus TaxID=857265 RepID=A0A0N0XHH0_9NEIS|nr:DUF4397 domain-containing protein [Amantichitinum ursilacus]KPC49100.1 hypothetical protein WG78_21310 [Amantichitinum ursilacus]
MANTSNQNIFAAGRRWIKPLVLAATLGSALALSACGGDDGVDDRLGLSKPSLRVVNAFPNSAKIDTFKNNAIFASNMDYLYAGAYIDIDDSDTTVTAALSGTNATIASSSTFKAATGHKYTWAYIAGTGATNDGVLIDDPYEKGLFSDKSRVRSLNAAFNAPNVDVYVLQAGQQLSTSTPTFSAVQFKSAVPASGQDSIDIDGGQVTVVVTDAGSKTPLFTSTQTSLSHNADWLITVLPQQGIAAVVPDQVKVLVVQANNANNAGMELTAATSAQ